MKELYETWFFLDCVTVSCYLRDVRNLRKVSRGVLCLVLGDRFGARVVSAMQFHGFAFLCGKGQFVRISPLR